MANHSINPFGSEQPKGKHFISQQQAVLHAFFPGCKTMKMVAVETNVMRSNITKYVSDWKALGKIEKIRTGRCPITKHPKVGFYTTDPRCFNQINQQLKLDLL